MAGAVGKALCIPCGKKKVAYKCEGCSQNFCLTHLAEHQQIIGEQLNNIEDQHNRFREVLSEQKTNLQKHSLIEQINKWEHDSIKKIRATAETTRNALGKHIREHINEIEIELKKFTEQLKQIREGNDFNEIIINDLKTDLNILEKQLIHPPNLSIQQDSSLFIGTISLVVSSASLYIPNIPINTKWIQNGITVAGGNGYGSGLNQLYNPWNVYVDHEHQTIYVADCSNHRIVEWKKNATSGKVVAGGNGQGNRNDQLSSPSDVIIDKNNDCFIICDYGNRRVVRWPRQNGTSGETIISDINCCSLAMDSKGCLYVSDTNKHEVKRWRIGDRDGIVVAGGNGQGNRLDQFNQPYKFCVDEDQSVYVSDCENHHVVKWMKDAKEGIVVAGGQSRGNGMTQLYHPHGVIVDKQGTVYVADYNNHRVIRWMKGTREGSVVVGGNGEGAQANQLKYPVDLSFDRENNLYVVDNHNHRIQKFDIL